MNEKEEFAMEYKEKSVTRILKPLMKNKKKIRKITSFYDDDFESTAYRIYMKRGYVNVYDWMEVDNTDWHTEKTEPEKIAHELDGWLDEIIMSDEDLKDAIEGIKNGEYKDIEWLD